MRPAVLLAAYALVIGVLVPMVLRRARWTHRAPGLAIVVWQGLTVSFCSATALFAYYLAVPTEHAHVSLVGLLHACGLGKSNGAVEPDAATVDALSMALPLAVVAVVLGSFAYEVSAARRTRSRHLSVLDVVGRRSARLEATVLQHHLPAAYCLPGRRPRVVVSQGALDLLSADQIDAVLEHERGHIAGRHHLVLAAASAFARVFPVLPLARHAREQTGLLLEMLADDRVLRSHPREVLASAMLEMAEVQTPRAAFAVGGPCVLVRLQRVLTPGKGPHPAARGVLATAAVVVPLLPFLLACSHPA